MPAPRVNVLGAERSPYLRQHAGNPVPWRPWGDAAFREARERNVPLFVSIGYSTCHWCHVMARESFQDPAVARLLDESFVCVKVDREERPDVDDVVMTGCQIFTQLTEGRASGGWPLNAFLEPARGRIFFVGTYWPPEPMPARPSFTQVVEAMAGAWRNRRDEVDAQAERLDSLIRRQLEPEASEPPAAAAAERADGSAAGAARDAAMRLMAMADPAHGGFGRGPKFPQAPFLELLQHTGVGPEHLALTLARMAAGGVADQAGGGFHRYAVDDAWRIPHFEKMLYDQGLLAAVYARHAVHAGAAWAAEVALRTCEAMVRELRMPHGAFAAALDAEADGREGVGYLWDPDRFRAALLADPAAAPHAAWAASLHGLDDPPGFRDPHHPELPAEWVLWRRTLTADPRLPAVHAALRRARDAGPRPRRDDKVIASWNGLAIRGLALCGMLLERPDLVDAAEVAAGAVERLLRGPDGILRRTWLDGPGPAQAFMEDYGCLAWGMAALARARPGAGWDERAARLLHEADERLRAPDGAWFDAAPGLAPLGVSARSLDDGAVPCGTSAALMAVADLADLSGDPAWRRRGAEVLAAIRAAVGRTPLSSTLSLVAAARLSGDDGEDPRRAVHLSLEPPAGPRDGWSLLLRIPPGLHVMPETLAITLAPPAGGGGVGGGGAGTAATAVEARIPPGGPGDSGAIGLRGSVRVQIRFPGDGRPRALDVRLQLCTERECLPPRTLRVAPPG